MAEHSDDDSHANDNHKAQAGVEEAESSLTTISSHVPIPSVRPWGATRRESSRSLSLHQRRSVRESLRNLSLRDSGSGSLSFGSFHSSLASMGQIHDDSDDDENITDNTEPNLDSASTATTTTINHTPGPGTLARQESWYKDLQAQGMTDADIAALLGGEDEEEEEEENQNNEDNASNGKSDTEADPTTKEDSHSTISMNMNEETTRAAKARAKQHVLERLGYDPWERAAEQQSSSNHQKLNSVSQNASDSSAYISFPPHRPLPPRPPPPPSQPTELFSWNPQPWIMNIMGDDDESNNKDDAPTSDLVVGKVIRDGTSDNSTSLLMKSHRMPVVCWGCGQACSVPMNIQTTLMRCPLCHTVSPAASTTNAKASTAKTPSMTTPQAATIRQTT